MQPATIEEAEQAEALLAHLSRPTTAKWLHGRLVALLSHYFVASNDEKVVEAMADDWHALLSPYPAWAIANACRWWLSRDNKDHRKKPMPGDIQERAHIETVHLRVARMALDRGVAGTQDEPERDEVTPQTTEERQAVAARVMAEVFGDERFKSKR